MALRDGIIVQYDRHKVRNGQEYGNCPKCFKVGLYPRKCMGCDEEITLYINMKRDLVSPYLIARAALPQGEENVLCRVAQPDNLVLPLTSPIEVNGWKLDPQLWHPWFTQWTHNPPNSLLLMGIYTGEWEMFTGYEEQVAFISRLARRSVLEG